MTQRSYTPSDERLALADSAARMLRERYAGHEASTFEHARWREFAELGWLAAPFSEANGGLGLPWSTVSAVLESLAPAAPAEPLATQWAEVGWVLDAAAPNALRDVQLAAWLAGERMLALAHGEDAAAPCRCTRVGEREVLSGRKTLVLDGGLAATLLVSAHDDEGRLAMFMVDADHAGVSVIARDSIDGRAHCDVVLDGVALAADARLAFSRDLTEVLADGQWLHAMLLAAESVGLLRAIVQSTHEYLVRRTQFGRPLIEMQVLQHRLVDMLLTLTRLESLLDVARCRSDELGPRGAAPFIAAAKAACGDEGRAMARQAVQLHGAIGLTAELALGRQLRRLMALEMLAGTSAEHRRHWCATRAAADEFA